MKVVTAGDGPARSADQRYPTGGDVARP